jgi:hypothetical protein
MLTVPTASAIETIYDVLLSNVAFNFNLRHYTKAKAKKGAASQNSVTKTEPCASFFDFFSPPEVPEDGAGLSMVGRCRLT